MTGHMRVIIRLPNVEPGDRVRFWDKRQKRVRQGTAESMTGEIVVINMGSRFGKTSINAAQIRHLSKIPRCRYAEFENQEESR